MQIKMKPSDIDLLKLHTEYHPSNDVCKYMIMMINMCKLRENKWLTNWNFIDFNNANLGEWESTIMDYFVKQGLLYSSRLLHSSNSSRLKIYNFTERFFKSLIPYWRINK